MTRKRMVALFLSLAMLLPLTAASGEGVLSSLVEKGAQTLLHTDNVTLYGEATFSLDDENFKDATVTHIQEGEKTYRDIRLTSPDEDGDTISSGYCYLIEGCDKGTFSYVRNHYNATMVESPRSAVLRETAGLNNLLSLLSSMMDVVEPTLPETALKQEGNTITLSLQENPPAIADTLFLHLLQQFGNGRDYINYYRLSSDSMEATFYETTTQQILRTTQSATLDSLYAVVTLDEQGRFAGVQGDITANLTFLDGTTHPLEVVFVVFATDYGTSAVPEQLAATEDLSQWLKDKALLDLTEIYSYTAEEAAEFLLEFQGLRLVAYHPSHPEWCYTWGTNELRSPFFSDWVYYPGEGALRNFLQVAAEKGWLSNAAKDTREAIMEYFMNFMVYPNETLQQYLTSGAYTPHQFLTALFRSCYGPQDGWNQCLTDWFTLTLESYPNGDTVLPTDAPLSTPTETEAGNG